MGFGDGYQLLLQTFDDYLKKFAEKRVGKDRAEGTLVNYTRSRCYLAAFLQYEYKLEDIPFRELKREFIAKYVVYLSTVRHMLPDSISGPETKADDLHCIQERLHCLRSICRIPYQRNLP